MPATSNADTEKKDKPAAHPANVVRVRAEEVRNFAEQPKQVRALIQSALALTHLELTYAFGSSSPSEGGMDCSGTIYHVLKFQGLHDVPRQSDEMCAWVRDHSKLHLTPTAHELSDAEFSALKPGDLVFWTGTYKTDRKLPVTHVMLYLGKHSKTGRHLLFGSSDGRSYDGERLCGVSVFDFKLPPEGSEARVYGYGAVPGLMPAKPEEADEEFDVLADTAVTVEKPKAGEKKEEETIKRAIVIDPPSVAKTEAVEKPVAPKKRTSEAVTHTESKPKLRRTTDEQPVHRIPARPQSSPGRVALNEVNQALRAFGKSVRDAFQQ